MGAPATAIHQRAWEKSQAGQPLSLMEQVALQQIDQDASRASGQVQTVSGYSGGANAQYKKAGKVAGKVLKVAAPIAALAIPGLGPLAAAGLAAGGNVAGRTLSGERFDPTQAALSGAGAYAARSLSGAPSAAGDVASTGAAGAAKKGLLSKVGDVLGGIKGTLGKIGITPAQALQGGLAGLGMIQGAQQQGKANQINDQLLQQLQGDEAGRQQLRQLALGRLQQPQGAMGNPFGQSYGRIN